MAKEKMTEAEKYRLERKKRISREKKKKNSYINRNRQKVNKIEKIVGITIGVIAVLVITVLLLDFFGVFNRIVTAAKVGDNKISVATMNCAYSTVQNEVYSQSQQAQQSYGQTLYDPQSTKLTDTCAIDSTKTWGQYFEEQALEKLKQVYSFKDAEGNTITSEQSAAISKQISEIADAASQNKYSLNAYLRQLYGTGVNEKVLRTWLEDVQKASNAQQHINDNYSKGITDEQKKEYYNEHKEDYMMASVAAYTLNIDVSKYTDKISKDGIKDEEVDKIIAPALDKAKTEAEKIYKAAQAGDSEFINAVNAYEKSAKGEGATKYDKDSIVSTGKVSDSALTQDSKDYIVSSDAKEGSVKLVLSKDYDAQSFVYEILKIKTAAYDYSTVNVRHILIKVSDTTNTEEMATAKEKAESIYEKWKKDPTEDNFAALAKENTEDSNADDGGLYENIQPGQMVTTFNDWCFDTSRKTGDSGIVETEYGYHIMYFVKNNGAYWKTAVENSLSQEFLTKTIKDAVADNEAVRGAFWWKVKGVSDYKEQAKTTTSALTTTAKAEDTTAAK